MRKLLIVIACLSLMGCATIPDISTDNEIVVDGESLGKAEPVKMPALPTELSKRRSRLPDMTDPTIMGQQTSAIAADRAYNDAAHQVNSLISLWDCVRQHMNENKDSSSCLKENK